MDIGCGGGDISFDLVNKGAIVVGIDRSDSMLKVAEARKASLSEEARQRVIFCKQDIMNLDESIKKQYDFIVAFGLIGYLESDDMFFNAVDELSHKGTVVILSCRNRLFNVTSISSNTLREIRQGNIINLIEEIDEYYKNKVTYEHYLEFAIRLNSVAGYICDMEKKKLNCESAFEDTDKDRNVYKGDSNSGTGDVQPRQSTPKELKETADAHGFCIKARYGVHPHLLLPRFNNMLPPQIFNLLSNTLCAFEDEDIAMVWSSVIVCCFEKNNN